jgi:hypothetical protein
MPHDIQPFVNRLVERVSIHGMGGEDPLWQMVSDTLIEYPTTVTTNTLIALYATSDGSFNAREVGMHRAERPLGYHFPKCGDPLCTSGVRQGQIIGELKDCNVARIRCKACKWRSKTVRIDQQPFFTPLHRTKAPLLFYHSFPSPTGLASIFLG